MTTDMKNSLISWKSIFAGLFVAMMTNALLSSLGFALSGASAAGAIQRGAGGSEVAGGLGFWVGLSVLISLAVGGYFAARVALSDTRRIGAAQGIVIASLFFVSMMWIATFSVGILGNFMGSFSRMMSSNNLASNAMVQSTLQKALSDTNLKSSPIEVVENLGAILLRGDTDGARSYLAYETGLPPVEIDSRLSILTSEFQTAIATASTAVARAVSSASLAMFFLFVLGLVSAGWGGAWGAKANAKRPLTEERPFGRDIPRPA